MVVVLCCVVVVLLKESEAGSWRVISLQKSLLKAQVRKAKKIVFNFELMPGIMDTE